jgi:hypothetical protein
MRSSPLNPLETAWPASCSGFYFIRPTPRAEAFMADWLAGAYVATADGTAVWDQRRFSDLLRATPRPVRSAFSMLRMSPCAECHRYAANSIVMLEPFRV